MNWKIQWFVNYDPRFNLRYAFTEGPFDRLKDAQVFVETLEHKYYEIVRQEYSGFRFGETKTVVRGSASFTKVWECGRLVAGSEYEVTLPLTPCAEKHVIQP